MRYIQTSVLLYAIFVTPSLFGFVLRSAFQAARQRLYFLAGTAGAGRAPGEIGRSVAELGGRLGLLCGRGFGSRGPGAGAVDGFLFRHGGAGPVEA